MLHAAFGGRRLVGLATADLEGLTIPNGELAPGAWGEGLVDRRHPHTYAHELMLSANDLLGGFDRRGELSLSVGKGFVPFGTDDPMVRPVIRYPVNHHLAQILERAVIIAAARHGPAGIEAALFNGDEPERPGQWPRVSHRLGDSWATRVTLTPASGLELQGSFAHVHSPEHRPGAGPDQAKWSGSVRWEGAIGGHPGYALAEWAERPKPMPSSFRPSWRKVHGRRGLIVSSGESNGPSGRRDAHAEPFRTLRPHLDDWILGRTRWTIITAGYAVRLSPEKSPVRIEPQLEVALGSV